MISANSTRAHRVDTSRDYRRVSTGLLWWREIRRAVRLAWYRAQLQHLIAEREHYMRSTAPGVLIGPEYLKNTERLQRRLQGLLDFIECRLDY